VCRAVHRRASLGALIHSSVVGANWRPCAGAVCGWSCTSGGGISTRRLRITVLLARPDHILRRVRAAGKGKLGLISARSGGLLLQQAHVFVAGARWGGLGVSDGSRDDTLLIGRSYKRK
jgi:hypothetical protein